MTLVLDWANLGLVMLPFVTSLTVGGFLALFLRKAAEQSRDPRANGRCPACVRDGRSVERGRCPEHEPLTLVPSLPIVLFISTTTFASLCYFFPGVVETYILPFNVGGAEYPAILLTLLFVTSAGAAVVVAGYFIQDLAYHRDLFNFGAAAASLAGLFLGWTASGPFGAGARSVVPLALTALLIGLAAEARSRRGRPILGLRSLAVCTAPLFLVTLLALSRILEILRLAAQSQ